MSRKILAICLFLVVQPQVFAWGERGHHLVTEVAARLVADRFASDDAAWAEFFQQNELLLAHLSNVPDIVWRSGDQAVRSANAPTHYVDLEYLTGGAKPDISAHLPTDFEGWQNAIEKSCQQPKFCAPGPDMTAKVAKTGHAPLRVQQFYNRLVAAMKRLQQLEKDEASAGAFRDTIDEILLNAGLLSHFVADLANPYHTTMDYDGWNRGQGGIHNYFESQIVSTYSLGLRAEVYYFASRQKPAASLMSSSDTKSSSASVLQKTWRLVLNSHSLLDQVNGLDRKYSLLEVSKLKPAERKPAAAVKGQFYPMIMRRLAMASDMLSSLWYGAWIEAGRPPLNKQRRGDYPVSPEFVPVDYLSSVSRPNDSKVTH